jgi:putative peptide zinc metalloprotease protein
MTGTAVGPPAGSSAVVTDATRVVFHPLSMRRDGDSWVIGRMDTGDFAVVPAVAHRAIALLSDGRTIGEVAGVLRQETGRDIAVTDFVVSLDGLGFLAAIDGRARNGPGPVRPSLPWLRPQHLRWLLHPALPWLVLGIIVAAAAMVITHPGLTPQYHDLVWSRHSGLVLAGNAALGWTVVWLHELGHLTTARAAGVPARLSLSTRLQFLAAQTDVSGVWAAPRRTRLTVYLAGIAVNLVIAALCVLTTGLAKPGGLAHHLLAAAALESVLPLPVQLLIFMRTDVYFLIQDLAGCANLYADGSARIRYLARRIRHAARRASSVPRDPAQDLPPRERRAVRAYSWLLLCGTSGSIAAAAIFAGPAAIALLAHAAGEMASSSPVGKADGVAAIIVCCGFQIVWLRTWWRRHGGRVSAYLQTRQQRAAGGR